jgi:uncharacterized repeat protein (TIGR01451 family)
VSTDDTCTAGFEDAQTAVTGLNINLFNGQSDTVCWKIEPDRLAPVDSNQQISGTITIHNPTGPGEAIATPIPVTVNTVSDIVSPGGAATVVCPGGLPQTLDPASNSAPGETLTCTYSLALGSSAAGTNTATANVDNGTNPDIPYSSAAKPFDPATGTVNSIDESASLDDDRKPSGFPQAFNNTDPNNAPVTYTESLSCPSSRTESNTAVLTETDTNTVRSDPAFVNITCNALSVTKTAVPTFDRRFDWTVKKYVSSDETCPEGLVGFEDGTLSINLFNGQSDTVCWKIVSDRGDAEDLNFAVTGTITITNGASIAANGVSVADSIAGVGAATVDCDPNTAGNQTTVNIPANSQATCTYASSLPNNTTRLNTATATLAGQNYEGTANIVFGTTPANIQDESASLDDDRGPIFTNLNDDRVDTYTEVLTCAEDAGTNSNTATLTELDTTTVRTDPAAVNLGCHGLTVTKSAATTYTRTFDWTVQKLVSTDDTCAAGFLDANDLATALNITLNVGQSDTVCWKIISDRGVGVDSDHAVSGTITIQNTAPIAATGVVVSDLITPGAIAGTVDCDGTAGAPFTTTVNIPASSSAQCTYSASLPDGTSRTNTGKATLAGVDYTGTAAVTFGDPTSVIDETATLDDIRDAAGLPKNLTGDDTHTYTESLACGSSRTESNTATLTEDDTGQIRTDPAVVNLTCVQPGQGCTPGFWKGHTEAWDQLTDPTVAGMPALLQFTTTTSFNDYFNLTPAESGYPDTFTMLDAVNAGGGGANKLARHGVSALLNEIAVNYPLPPGINSFTDLYNAIRNAFITDVFEPLATQLAANNDLDHSACPN